jgi:hypothetical protein
MSKLIRVTASGEEHGIINTLTNSNEFNDFKHSDPKTKAELQKQQKEDAKLVKVRYLNHRGRHERLTKPYCRYAGDPIHIWHMIPGQEYEVPMGLVKEVNGKRLPVRSGLVSVDGNDVNQDASPLEADQPGECIHELVPAKFF